MILYFSGCGNSRFVAEELGRLTCDEVRKMNVAENNSVVLHLDEDESLGIVCPVYAWAVPRVVEEYVQRIELDITPSHLWLACTCGDNVGKTPEKFARTIRRKGWHLDAAYGFVMPETYVNLKGFKLDSRENENRKIAAARERLPLVAESIRKREHIIDVVRGAMPWAMTYLTNPLFYGAIITDRKFRVTDDCIGCGKCQKVCPLNNISMENSHPVWHGNCTNCMACYHHCSKTAIQFGKATEGKGRYYFGHSIGTE